MKLQLPAPILALVFTVAAAAGCAPAAPLNRTPAPAAPAAAVEATAAATAAATADSATSPISAPAAPAAAAPASAAAGAEFDRRGMVAAIVNERILPEHEAFVAAAGAQQAAVAELAAAPGPATLAAAQDRWRAAAEAWAAIEPFQLRFSMLVSSEIKKWPINVAFVEELLAGATPVDASALSMAGSTAKGMAALEYLLFAPGDEAAVLAALTASPRRLDYAAAVADDLARLSENLLYLWSPEGDGHAQALIDASLSPNNMVAGSISMLTNEMIAQLEGIVKTRLSYPLHGTDGLARPEAVESPYAGHSVPLIVANLATMEAVFEEDLAPYVTYLAGDDQLAAAIRAQFDRTFAALAALTLPLETAVVDDPDAVAAARDEVRNLLRLIKVDLANQMGITVTFSDNDGD